MTLYLLLSFKGNLRWSDINSSPETVLWIKRQTIIEGGFVLTEGPNRVMAFTANVKNLKTNWLTSDSMSEAEIGLSCRFQSLPCFQAPSPHGVLKLLQI